METHIQTVVYEGVAVRIFPTGEIDVVGVNEQQGIIKEINVRVVEYLNGRAFKSYPLAVSEGDDIRRIIRNVLQATQKEIPLHPVRGITPRPIHIQNRIRDIKEGIERMVEHYRTIPPEWIEEYNELVEYMRKGNKQE